MSKMRRVYHSVVQFRPNPADDSNALLLGILVGFRTERAWAVGLALRGSLPSDVLGRLDPLSQAMLENRSEVLKRQLEDVLDSLQKPEQVLMAIADRNFTSFYVAPPKAAMVDVSVRPSTTSMQKMAEDFVLTLFSRVNEEKKASDNSASPEHSQKSEIPADVTPPWMLGTQLWYRPNI